MTQAYTTPAYSTAQTIRQNVIKQQPATAQASAYGQYATQTTTAATSSSMYHYVLLN